MIRPPPRSTPFPYTTLFRSLQEPYPRNLAADSLRGERFGKPCNSGRMTDRAPSHEHPWINMGWRSVGHRSEEHTFELQSHLNLVCRLLLKKKTQTTISSLTH